MQPSTQPRVVVGFFAHTGQMKEAKEHLHRAGFPEERITVHEGEGRQNRGLLIGVAVGAILGVIAGIIVAGRMAGMRLSSFRFDSSRMLPGAMIGAVFGSLIAAIGKMAQGKETTVFEAEKLPEDLNALIVDAGDRYGWAEEILRNEGAYRIIHRYPEWRTGYTGLGQAFEAGNEIRIPVFEEKVEVEKVPVVAQQLRVRKRKAGEIKEISDVVKGEAVRIERHGDVEVHLFPKERSPFDEGNH
ncbi:MAG: DUF2382 domain-containing protein [Chloroflexota bacterium]